MDPGQNESKRQGQGNSELSRTTFQEPQIGRADSKLSATPKRIVCWDGKIIRALEA